MGQTSDLIEITNGDLTARINPLGAELWSLTDAQGREYMTDADPAFWGGHAPLLFPIVGSLSGDVLRLDGTAYPLPRHGFARRSVFAPVHVEAGLARFRLTDSPDTRAVYPFGFVLEVTFRVDGMTLFTQASVTNPNAGVLPFSFGYHPAFAWPLPGGAAKAAHKLVFEAEEPQDIRRVARDTGLLLDGEGARTGAVRRPVPRRCDDLGRSGQPFAIIWRGWRRMARYRIPRHAFAGHLAGSRGALYLCRALAGPCRS